MSSIHLAGRDQRDRRHRLGDVLDVVALEEDAVLRREEERQPDGDDEDARLAAAEQAPATRQPRRRVARSS
jgi:hypothetical protein